jgi:hypothetical protein
LGGGDEQKDEEKKYIDEEALLSQSNPENEYEIPTQQAHLGDVDEEMVDYKNSVEKEKLEMEEVESKIEERARKLEHLFDFQQNESRLEMEDKRDKRENFTTTSISSTRVRDKTLVMEKVKSLKESSFHLQKKGINSSNSFSISSDFDQPYFDSLAEASGIRLGNDSTSTHAVLETLVAQEKAQTTLSVARLKKERDDLALKKKEKEIILEGDKEVLEEKSMK